MNLDRKELLAALQTVTPALSTKDLLPLLQRVWFDGAVMRATNGELGIEVPFTSDFTGGIPGRVLLGFVESLNRDALKTETDEKSITLVSDRARIKLPLEPAARAVWPFVAANAEPITVPLDEGWKSALEFTMLSVDNTAAKSQLRGVTFAAGSHSVSLYATDNSSLAWAKMDEVEGLEEDICVPGEFVHETLRLMKDDGNLLLRPNTVEAHNDQGTKIYSKLLDISEKPIKFRDMVQRHLKGHELVPLPDGMKEALERAELLKDNKDGVPAKLTFVDNDIIVVEATSSFGDLKEELYTEGGHAEITASFTPSLLLRGIGKRDQFAVTKNCVILNGPENFTYLVSAYEGKK